MKLFKRLISVVSIAILLQSCASYKAPTFDSEANLYKNYKSNFVIEIDDNYKLIKSKNVQTKRRGQIGSIASDSVEFYNANSSTSLLFSNVGPTRVISESEKIDLLEDILKQVTKNVGRCAGCPQIQVTRTKDVMLIEAASPKYAFDTKTFIKLMYIPVEKGSSRYNLFVFEVISATSEFNVAKTDLLKVIDSLQLHAFNEEERVFKA